MTSTIIYSPITPTYLYIKQHSVTGLKYFGKTTKLNPYKYPGSGTYWTKHFKKHGKKYIKTIWVSDLYYDTSIVEIALHFSIENNIVESDDWANLKLENGLDGGITGTITSEKTKAKMSVAKMGKSNPNYKKIPSEETKVKQSIANKRNSELALIPFVTLISTRKTYAKNNASRYLSELKQFF
jgi:hypothetical protein